MTEDRLEKRFGACILAAGFSSRMGMFKPLLPLGDKTVIERVLAVSKAAGIKDIAVVTGYNREALLPVIEREAAAEIYNPDFEKGMFTSIQAGAASMPSGLDGFFIMPVDCPLITGQVLRQLMEQFERDKFAVPCYRGKKGHPLLVPECFRQEIVEHDGKGGLKAVTDRDFDRMKRVETGYEGVILDMDTPNAYEEVLDYLKHGCRSESLQQLAEGRRFFLVRHGQIRQHKEKIFLGQTDVPLSEEGHRQAEAAGAELKQICLYTDRLYSSDLLRAAQTAEAIQEQTGLAHLVLDKGLREMNLGPWDGKFISEIKEQMPLEYEKRGNHIMTYKMGHGSENFFDLQYRVVKALIRILKSDSSRDIVVVAHSGVLRVICTNLQGLDVSQNWDKMKNGQVRMVQM